MSSTLGGPKVDPLSSGALDLKKTQSKVRPPKRWGLRIAILLGLLLGLAIVLFFLNVYNPFGATVSSPMVLLPPDADFVLNLPDLPGFLTGLRETDFANAMANHKGIQEFLRSETMREHGLVELVQEAFRKLDRLSDSMPLGMSLLPDVTGRQVLLAGYLPTTPEEPLRYMLVFRPESWKAIAGANALLSPRLSKWFITERLKQEGVTLGHTRDMVSITFPESESGAVGKSPSTRQLWLTRIADVLLLSTEERQLAQIRTSVERDGLPSAADPRYASLDEFLEEHPVQLLAKRGPADQFVKLPLAWTLALSRLLSLPLALRHL
jgi:hypothetical protein